MTLPSEVGHRSREAGSGLLHVADVRRTGGRMVGVDVEAAPCERGADNDSGVPVLTFMDGLDGPQVRVRFDGDKTLRPAELNQLLKVLESVDLSELQELESAFDAEREAVDARSEANREGRVGSRLFMDVGSLVGLLASGSLGGAEGVVSAVIIAVCWGFARAAQVRGHDNAGSSTVLGALNPFRDVAWLLKHGDQDLAGKQQRAERKAEWANEALAKVLYKKAMPNF